MAHKRKTLAQYRTEDRARIVRMNVARKRKAAERHDATAARLRAEAVALETEQAS
jgi:hypothetical protein